MSARERILLVEDDPEISDLIARQTLKSLGYQVEVVKTASTAIQQAARFAPDMIIANLNLRGLSGKDLLVALDSQGLDVPVSSWLRRVWRWTSSRRFAWAQPIT